MQMLLKDFGKEAHRSSASRFTRSESGQDKTGGNRGCVRGQRRAFAQAAVCRRGQPGSLLHPHGNATNALQPSVLLTITSSGGQKEPPHKVRLIQVNFVAIFTIDRPWVFAFTVTTRSAALRPPAHQIELSAFVRLLDRFEADEEYAGPIEPRADERVCIDSPEQRGAAHLGDVPPLFRELGGIVHHG